MNELIEKIIKFRNERNWEQFQDIKDLLLGLNIEVGELQEQFLWSNKDIDNSIEINYEIADVFIFLVYICDKLKIDLKDAVLAKLKIHEDHYPIELSKDKTVKYTNLGRKS